MSYTDLTVDVLESLSKAHDSEIPFEEKLRVREHLTRILSTLLKQGGTDTLTPQIKEALAVLDTEIKHHKTFAQKYIYPTLKAIGLLIVGAIIGKYIK